MATNKQIAFFILIPLAIYIFLMPIFREARKGEKIDPLIFIILGGLASGYVTVLGMLVSTEEDSEDFEESTDKNVKYAAYGYTVILFLMGLFIFADDVLGKSIGVLSIGMALTTLWLADVF